MKLWMGLAGVSLSLALAGCGGGGGSQPAGSGGRAQVPVFLTDSPETENDHVWATIFKVEVQNQSGQTETLFDDPTGHAVDLKSLHDAAGPRFAFLSNAGVSSGTHTGIRVTLANNLTLFARGSTTGQAAPLDDSLAHDAQGHAIVAFPLGAPRNLASGSDDVVIDFDLANFTVQNGKLRPSLHEGDRSRLRDLSRHEHDEHSGTVSNLAGTAPNFTFTLQLRGGTVTVVTDASTVLFNSDASANPTLANGQSVEVTGVFDAAANRLTATRIKIEDRAQHGAEVEAEGVASAVNAAAGTFAVSALKVRGFQPEHTTVNVVTNSATVLRGSGGIVIAADIFFSALSTAKKVEVEGTFDAASNTLTATRARLEDERDDAGGHDGEARGTAVNVNAASRTFGLQPVTEFDGFALSGTSVNVVTNGSTRFRNGDATVTADAFFAALAAAPTVQVEGTFAGGTFTATSARVRTSGGNGGVNGGGGGGGGHDDGPGHS